MTSALGKPGTSEVESLAELDGLIEQHDLATRTYREVRGWVDQPRFMTSDKPRLRIDRIVFPSSRLEAAGWPHGPFGIEAKRPGKKLGSTLAQAMDYHRCVFEIRAGYHLRLEWVFLWPYEPQQGDMASVMAQHRVGTVISRTYRPLQFAACYGSNAIVIYQNGDLEAKGLASGKKRGAR